MGRGVAFGPSEEWSIGPLGAFTSIPPRPARASFTAVAAGVVLPFEVAAPRSELYFGLLALSKTPAAQGIYRQRDLLRHVVSFFWRQTFHCLADAVAAALRAGRAVRVLRNATLPPAPPSVIPPGAVVMIASRGGPWRLRHLPYDDENSLFAICNGAVLTISGLRFQALRPSCHWPPGRDMHVRFATVLPDREGAGRLEIAGDVTFDGYAEIAHRAIGARELRLFEQLQ